MTVAVNVALQRPAVSSKGVTDKLLEMMGELESLYKVQGALQLMTV